MFSWVLIYSVIYLFFFFIGRISIQSFLKDEIKHINQSDSILLNEITLLVPFRDEELRIKPLLDSLVNSKELPKEIIFINDHSIDNTIKLIESTLLGQSFKILHSMGNGKKAAIQLGVSVAETSYILTMDADVRFNTQYFSTVTQLKQSDMWILPVVMQSKGWRTLFELDVYMANSINLIASGLKQAIMASGANLLFKKTAYAEYSSIVKHQHILSGDDQFLLADFIQNEKEVHVSSNEKLSVSTPSPLSTKELIAQRLRWIQKTPFVPDPFALKIGIVQLIVTVSFLILAFLCIIKGEFIQLFVLFAIKSFLDVLLAYPYLMKIKKRALLFLVPIYTIVFPFYTVILAFLSLFYKPTWKGRRTMV